MSGDEMWRREITALIGRIEQEFPRASLMYARILIELLNTPGRMLSQPDLAERVGKERDADGIHKAMVRLEAMGIIKRNIQSSKGMGPGGHFHTVELVRTAALSLGGVDHDQ